MLLPIGGSSESPWALLNALLPAATAAHAAMLQQAAAMLQPEAMAANCRDAHAAFGGRLQQHLASLTA